MREDKRQSDGLLPFEEYDINPFEQEPGETVSEYHKRLVYGKLVDRSLSDIDYSEIAEEVYGKSYSSDVARRMLYGSRYTYEELEKEAQSEKISDYADSVLDEKTLEYEKEKTKASDQKREYGRLIRSEGRFEHLIKDTLKESAEKLNETVGVMYSGCDVDMEETGNREAVLVFSDWHYGMTTDNIFNRYDTEICRDRVRTVTENAARRILLNRCRALHVVVLGDLIHGAIHTSARVASEEMACDQLMHVSEMLAQSVEELAKYVPSVKVYVTYGNHGRAVAKKEDSIHRDNFERIIPWWLEYRLAPEADRITVMPESENEFLFFDVCGHGFCAAHGDLDNVRSAPCVLSTLSRRACGKDIECILLGDKHHTESFDDMGITSLLCGALCGSDDYANNKRLYSSPSQLLLTVTPEDGVDAEYRLKCE